MEPAVMKAGLFPTASQRQAAHKYMIYFLGGDGEEEEAAIFNLTMLGLDEPEEKPKKRQVKERGDEGALAADILEDLNTDSIRSLRRSFHVIGGEDGVQEGEFVKMMLSYLDPDDGLTRRNNEVTLVRGIMHSS